MTMDMKENEASFLSESLFENQRPVTYRILARELHLHHSDAKTLIYDFYTANQDKLSATFVITGIDSNDAVYISRATAEEVATRIKSLKTVHTVHIYSLCAKETFPSNAQISLEESKYALNYDNLEQYFDQGLIKGPELAVVTSLAPSRRPQTSSPLYSPAVKQDPSAKKPLDGGLASKYVSRKAAAVATSKPQQTSAGLSSNYVSRKASAKPTSSTKTSVPTKKPVYEYKSRKAEAKQPKERVIISSISQDTAEEEKPVMRPSSSDIHKLFADDSDFSDHEDDDNVKLEPEAVVIPEEETEEVMEVEQEPDVRPSEEDMHEDTRSSAKQQFTEVEEINASPEESYYDEEGYLVTVNKQENKTISQPARPVRKPENELTKPGPVKKKKGQASLMSFFQPNKKE